ncbi:transposase [Cyanobacteria bacterium FACHB-DQ100]|nr:transposase [Cyanobacteria bacterium FACHB-DQ100]
MSRLSDSDKSQIIELYRQSGETTLTLAERYGVSNTTISRILKSSLSAEEYDSLIQQKRSASRGGARSTTVAALTPCQAPENVQDSRGGARSTTVAEAPPVQGSLLEPEAPIPLEPEAVEPREAASKPAPPRRVRRANTNEASTSTPAEEAPELAQIEAIDLSPTVDSMADDEDDDEDLDDLDNLDEDLEDEDDDEPAILPSIQLSAAEFIRVLPIAEAAIPRTCYLVVDRAAELVARPLSEFAELGQIPSGEVEARTLPVFDNHRVAKRFSNIRTQRVIKIPDSRVLQKAAPYLQAKGITRLLIDGQVYAL